MEEELDSLLWPLEVFVIYSGIVTPDSSSASLCTFGSSTGMPIDWLLFSGRGRFEREGVTPSWSLILDAATSVASTLFGWSFLLEFALSVVVVVLVVVDAGVVDDGLCVVVVVEVEE